jgi:PncC family amidohydrolase
MNDELRALSRRTGERLLRANWRLASAESCTGGLIGHALTEIAGSSAYYQGGVIAYDNAVKEHVLGVDPATLATVGAVSEACAKEMVAGVRRLLHTAVGVATTGIAGPEGGTPTKPVGLVFIAVATPDAVRCERHIFAGDRSAIKLATARRALELVVELMNQTTHR